MNQGPMPPGFVEMFVCALVVGLAIGITIQVFFLLTLSRTQSEVAESNREISPGKVWLTLLLNWLPIIGSIWILYMVAKLSSSLRREYEDRRWNSAGEGFGKTSGSLCGWGGLIANLINGAYYAAIFSGEQQVATGISVLTMPLSIGLLICFIMYWVQMYQYGKRLREERRGYRSGSAEDDYDDERRPRRDPETDDDDYRRRRDREEF